MSGWLGVLMMPGDDVLMMPAGRRIEVFTGAGRRRRWSAGAKAQIVAESYAMSVGEAADRHGLSKTQVFTWRRDAQQAAAVKGPQVVETAPSSTTVVAPGSHRWLPHQMAPEIADEMWWELVGRGEVDHRISRASGS